MIQSTSFAQRPQLEKSFVSIQDAIIVWGKVPMWPSFFRNCSLSKLAKPFSFLSLASNLWPCNPFRNPAFFGLKNQEFRLVKRCHISRVLRPLASLLKEHYAKVICSPCKFLRALPWLSIALFVFQVELRRWLLSFCFARNSRCHAWIFTLDSRCSRTKIEQSTLFPPTKQKL